MKKRLYISIILGFVLSITIYGQQFPVFSQYWTNKFLLNPAVAGHEGYTAVNLTARKQMAGIEGTPATFAVSAQTRILRKSYMSRSRNPRKRRTYKSKSGKVGYGGYIVNDNSGVFNKLGAQGTYSYHLNLNRAQLSFGVSLTAMQFSINKDEIILNDYNDVMLAATSDRGYFLDGNFGAYYSDKDLYAGLATHNLFASFIKLNDRNDTAAKVRMERQYLLMGGYRFSAIDFVFLEPSFNFKFAENVVSQIDLNLTAYFKEDYWGGLAFRSGSNSKITTETLGGRGSWLIIYAGARIDKVYFGYSFDYTISSLQHNSFGSHEIMIAMRFGDNARRYRWLNRY